MWSCTYCNAHTTYFLSPSSRWFSLSATEFLKRNPRLPGLRRAERFHADALREFLAQRNDVCEIEIKTLRGCGLGIGRYPDFAYNAEGGGGRGTAQASKDGRLAVLFDTEKLLIPALGFDTATFLGLPLPPFVRIDVVPRVFRGFIERDTGKVELEFSAKFIFSLSSLYRPPPLLVKTILSTEMAQGRLRTGKGRRLDSTGRCRLVGVAHVPKINDAFMNAFLMLPTECLADMEAQITFF